MGRLLAVLLIFFTLSGDVVRYNMPVTLADIFTGRVLTMQAPAADAPAEEEPEAPAEEEWEAPAAESSGALYKDVVFRPVTIETEEDLYGDWLREPMYLEYYGCESDMLISLYQDGTYYKLLTNHNTGEVLSTETGTWRWEDNEVITTEYGETSSVHLEEENGYLVNNSKRYTKIG